MAYRFLIENIIRISRIRNINCLHLGRSSSESIPETLQIPAISDHSYLSNPRENHIVKFGQPEEVWNIYIFKLLDFDVISLQK